MVYMHFLNDPCTTDTCWTYLALALWVDEALAMHGLEQGERALKVQVFLDHSLVVLLEFFARRLAYKRA